MIAPASSPLLVALWPCKATPLLTTKRQKAKLSLRSPKTCCGKLSVLLAGSDWRRFFDAYERDAFRLETLPVYAMDEEEAEYAHWKDTGELVVSENDPWLTRLRHFQATGRTIGRVHVITRPLTDYLRFQFAFYPQQRCRRRKRADS